jgi:hypothetical protein
MVGLFERPEFKKLAEVEERVGQRKPGNLLLSRSLPVRISLVHVIRASGRLRDSVPNKYLNG